MGRYQKLALLAALIGLAACLLVPAGHWGRAGRADGGIAPVGPSPEPGPQPHRVGLGIPAPYAAQGKTVQLPGYDGGVCLQMYVGTSGSDTGPCTSAGSPCATKTGAYALIPTRANCQIQIISLAGDVSPMPQDNRSIEWEGPGGGGQFIAADSGVTNFGVFTSPQGYAFDALGLGNCQEVDGGGLVCQNASAPWGNTSTVVFELCNPPDAGGPGNDGGLCPLVMQANGKLIISGTPGANVAVQFPAGSLVSDPNGFGWLYNYSNSLAVSLNGSTKLDFNGSYATDLSGNTLQFKADAGYAFKGGGGLNVDSTINASGEIISGSTGGVGFSTTGQIDTTYTGPITFACQGSGNVCSFSQSPNNLGTPIGFLSDGGVQITGGGSLIVDGPIQVISIGSNKAALVVPGSSRIAIDGNLTQSANRSYIQDNGTDVVNSAASIHDFQWIVNGSGILFQINADGGIMAAGNVLMSTGAIINGPIPGNSSTLKVGGQTSATNYVIASANGGAGYAFDNSGVSQCTSALGSTQPGSVTCNSASGRDWLIQVEDGGWVKAIGQLTEIAPNPWANLTEYNLLVCNDADGGGAGNDGGQCPLTAQANGNVAVLGSLTISGNSVNLPGGASVGSGNVATFNQFSSTGTSGNNFNCTGAAQCQLIGSSGQSLLLASPGANGSISMQADGGYFLVGTPFSEVASSYNGPFPQAVFQTGWNPWTNLGETDLAVCDMPDGGGAGNDGGNCIYFTSNTIQGFRGVNNTATPGAQGGFITLKGQAGANSAATGGGGLGGGVSILGFGGGASGATSGNAGNGGNITAQCGVGGAATTGGSGSAGTGGTFQANSGNGGAGSATIAGGNGGIVQIASGAGGVTGGAGAGSNGAVAIDCGTNFTPSANTISLGGSGNCTSISIGTSTTTVSIGGATIPSVTDSEWTCYDPFTATGTQRLCHTAALASATSIRGWNYETFGGTGTGTEKLVLCTSGDGTGNNCDGGLILGTMAIACATVPNITNGITFDGGNSFGNGDAGIIAPAGSVLVQIVASACTTADVTGNSTVSLNQ